MPNPSCTYKFICCLVSCEHTAEELEREYTGMFNEDGDGYSQDGFEPSLEPSNHGNEGYSDDDGFGERGYWMEPDGPDCLGSMDMRCARPHSRHDVNRASTACEGLPG